MPQTRLACAASFEPRSRASLRQAGAALALAGALLPGAVVAQGAEGQARAVAASVAEAAATPEAPRLQRLRLDMHSSFLMNLHHSLLEASRRQDALPAEQPSCSLDRSELTALNQARAYYAQQFQGRHPLFDEGLSAIKQALRQAEDGRQQAQGLAGLPEALAQQLDAAAPAYRRCLWPAHEASNRRWAAEAQALDARFGAAVQARLERQFAQAFTREPLRIDLVFATGTFEGAYSSDAPEHVVMPSGRRDYQGDAALEMLYHEASHVGVMSPLFRACAAALEATPRPRAQQLWHALQFYTVGLAVQQVLREEGGRAYTSYAERGDLFRRARWQHVLPALEAHWLPWLRQGQPGLRPAVEALVQALPQQLAED